MRTDGVAKSPPYGVTAFFQDLDILTYAFVPEKPPSLVGRNFCLAIHFSHSLFLLSCEGIFKGRTHEISRFEPCPFIFAGHRL
jgi:hypothetical protein